MISKETVRKAYDQNQIQLVLDDGGKGIVCQIGERCFYFGGQTAEEYTSVEQYKADFWKDDIISDIFDALDAFSTAPEILREDYLYWEKCLNGHSNTNTPKYVGYVQVTGRVKVEINKDDISPERAKQLISEEVAEYDFGKLYDIDWEVVKVEEE